MMNDANDFIFVTVGSWGFSELINQLLNGDTLDIIRLRTGIYNIVIQYGNWIDGSSKKICEVLSKRNIKVISAETIYEYELWLSYLKSAKVIICSGGIGTLIRTIISPPLILIVVANPSLINDHQSKCLPSVTEQIRYRMPSFCQIICIYDLNKISKSVQEMLSKDFEDYKSCKSDDLKIRIEASKRLQLFKNEINDLLNLE